MIQCQIFFLKRLTCIRSYASQSKNIHEAYEVCQAVDVVTSMLPWCIWLSSRSFISPYPFLHCQWEGLRIRMSYLHHAIISPMLHWCLRFIPHHSCLLGYNRGYNCMTNWWIGECLHKILLHLWPSSWGQCTPLPPIIFFWTVWLGMEEELQWLLKFNSLSNFTRDLTFPGIWVIVWWLNGLAWCYASLVVLHILQIELPEVSAHCTCGY